VCRKGLRTLASNLLFAFAFPWLQTGVPKSQPFVTGALSSGIDMIQAASEE
jgi:hypothetical protein